MIGISGNKMGLNSLINNKWRFFNHYLLLGFGIASKLFISDLMANDEKDCFCMHC
jgi:hypothetical protein